MIRLRPNHAPKIRYARAVSFTFDGESYEGREGESVLSALLRAGAAHLRDAPQDGAPRGGFCCMGLCQECAVSVEGRRVEACRVPLRAGLCVGRAR